MLRKVTEVEPFRRGLLLTRTFMFGLLVCFHLGSKAGSVLSSAGPPGFYSEKDTPPILPTANRAPDPWGVPSAADADASTPPHPHTPFLNQHTPSSSSLLLFSPPPPRGIQPFYSPLFFFRTLITEVVER